jgi:hypothetical protein
MSAIADSLQSLISAKYIDFLVNLLAGVVGILIVLSLERKRRPKILMKIGKTEGLPANDPGGRKECRWPHIEVHNSKIAWWLSWVYDGDPAFACRAWISFHNPTDGGRIFSQEMPARWSESHPPTITRIQLPSGASAAGLEVAQYAIDIPTGDRVTLAPVYRARDSDSCHGWNNESYLHGFEHPLWKLDKGRYAVRIRVVTGGREFVDAFKIINDAPFDDFRLEELDQESKAILINGR